MAFELIITPIGLLFAFTQGPIAFFLMRFAEKVCNDPGYEDKVFKRSKGKKK